MFLPPYVTTKGATLSLNRGTLNRRRRPRLQHVVFLFAEQIEMRDQSRFPDKVPWWTIPAAVIVTALGTAVVCRRLSKS